jgi:Mg-chelatase subunit ChlD
MEPTLEIEETESERTGGTGGTGLLAFVILISCATHLALMYACSDCAFAPLPDSIASERKWTKQKPVMQVKKMTEDPLARMTQKARPAAAPVVEQQSDRVSRLESAVTPAIMPKLPRPASADPVSDAMPSPAKPEAAEWTPRQKIAEIEAPTVPDDQAALPRLVIPKVERVDHAVDITPAYDLISAPSAVGSGIDGGSPSPDTPPADTADGAVAPAPPPAAIPQPIGLGGGISPALDRPPSLTVLSAAEEAAAKKAADEARAAEKAGKAAERLQAEAKAKAAKPPPAPTSMAVDEKKVADEKEAVRSLRDETTPQGRPFEKHVNFMLGSWTDPANPQEKYFRIVMSSKPENPLPVVSKDIIYLMDASGSIMNDRLKACRKAISKSLRMLNTGDRFNVIAFRDKFSYAFPDSAWRDVTEKSLDEADDWLSNLTAHGQTDVFRTLRGVLAMPRDPTRPMVAFFITDGDATSGMTRSAEIISRFSELNDGLVSIYMYGVKANANAYLMDMVTRSSRGGWRRHNGMRWTAASGIPELARKFERPVLTDITVLFTTSSNSETYPRLVTNLCADEPIEIYGKCPANQKELVFSMRGLNGATVFENIFTLPFSSARKLDETTRKAWAQQRMYAMIAAYTRAPNAKTMRDIRAFAARYGIEIPYEKEIK